MKFVINIKYLLAFSLAFMLFTAIGTISHEFGHIVVAKSLGYETKLHSSSMSYNFRETELYKRISEIYNKNSIAIESKSDFKQKEEYEKGVKQINRDVLLILIGGPLQTILTGMIGLLLLFWRRREIRRFKLKLIDWLAVFLSLFWLREAFNLFMSVSTEIISPNGSYFGGDEKRISIILNLWSGTFSVILGAIGFAVAVFIIFKIIPQKLRLSFIISGLIGGIFGYILWLNILGPKILP